MMPNMSDVNKNIEGRLLERQLAAARRDGYLKALDDVMRYIGTCTGHKLSHIPAIVMTKRLESMKTEYLKGQNDGNKS
jgi:hypothetical protein